MDPARKATQRKDSILPMLDFHFVPVAKGQVVSNNLVQNLFTKDTVRHLVNETAQNSTDAAKANFPGTPARLDFRIKTISRAALEPFGISSVELHAAACSEKTIAKSIPAEDLRVLLFEDRSGGLSGPAGIDSDSSTPLGRYTFSVGSGVDGKSGADNGRHGIGSGTGTMVSNARCMYFTSTRIDGSTIGSGRVSLTTHKLNDEPFNPEARLGILDESEWKGLLQGDDADLLHLELGFSRGLEEPGLSCAVIDPVAEINGYTLLASILSWQFIQILRGEIEFRVVDETAGIDLSVNAHNIDELIQTELFGAIQHAILRRGRPGLQQGILSDLPILLEFVRSYPGIENFPRVNSETPSDIPQELRSSWLEGQSVGVAFPVTATNVENETVEGTISTWVKPLKTGAAGYDIYIRDSIVNIDRASGRCSLTMSQGDPCSVLFGDAEDPSHTHYREANAQNRGWKDFRSALRTFKAAPSILLAAISGDAGQGDRLALARFFPMPGTEIRSTSDGGAAEEEAADLGEVVVPADGGSDDVFIYKKDRRSSTLTMTLTPTAKKACEAGKMVDLKIIAEYAGSKPGCGSFTESNTTFSVERGVEESTVSKNVLVLRGVDSDLKVVIRNVDLKRDLRIRNEIADMEDEAAA